MAKNKEVEFYRALVRASNPESYIFAPLLELSANDCKKMFDTFKREERLGIGRGWKVKRSWVTRQS